MAAARFVTFEGGEGAGKSTQVARLAAALADAGVAVRRTREPGGSLGAEEIRGLIVGGAADRWDARTEALLIAAARRDHVVRTIRPALAAGEWVLCDRFTDSTMAYQGVAGGVGREAVDWLRRFAADDLEPDLTLVIDVPVAMGLARAAARADGKHRFELRDRAFHERLRAAFLEIAAGAPRRCAVVDGAAAPDAVAAAVRDAVRERLGVALP
ncbi:MAG: dTMP kinase [Alphaproteobacteria bacterium]|nr:dTMP kinase [Alphaproteobacteria bacterium]